MAESPGAVRAPAIAGQIFGDRLSAAVEYARLLATEGVVRGVIGPREVDRLWDRHILNCAVIADLIPAESDVLDVGSGAGLPGVVLALARPDLDIVLLDAQARRIAFLADCVAQLGLQRVTLLQGRVEETPVRRQLGRSSIVTARALAPLDRLAEWCLPVLKSGGHLLAIKGVSASDEVARHRQLLGRYGANEIVVRHCGAGVVDPQTTVIDIAID
jgi:16S rRNA (guanine527-N7)-methyltransferase